MGCMQSSLLDSQKIKELSDQKDKKMDRKTLNIGFSDFVKGNTGHVYQQYQFTGWVNKSPNSIVRWAWHKRSEAERIVKIIKRNEISQPKAMKQINCLKKIDHPNIVKLYEYFIDQEFIYMIFEPIYGKRIYNPIVGAQEKVLRNLRPLMNQILQAVEHCHSRGIAHFNLLPQNIMVSGGGEDNGKIFVKLVGFGNCILIQDTIHNTPLSNSFKDNIDHKNDLNSLALKDYKPKKILSKDSINEKFRSPQETTKDNVEKQDIWSCGILMQMILSRIFGIPKFLSLPFDQLTELMRNKSKSLKQSQQSIDLLVKMLDKNPSTRFSAFQCLNHNYFSTQHKSSPWKITGLYRSLHSFQIKQKFKTFLTMYITFKQSTIFQQSQFLTQFYNLDQNKDGMLQYDELLQGLKNHFQLQENQATQYINQIFQKLDRNKNGCIEYSEFLLGTVNIASLLQKKSIKNLFNQIDKNGDGFIDQQEIKSMMHECSSSVDGILSKFAQNKNKTQKGIKISLKQFEQLIKSLYQQGKFQRF